MGKKGPTLFELMGEPRRAARPLSSAPNPAPLQIDEPDPRVFGSSRALRVPMGYLFVAGAVVVAVLALAYSVGFQAGQNKRDRMDAREIASGVGGDVEPIRDPLMAPASTSAAPSREPSGTSSAPARQSSRSPARTPIGGDPRIPDMNYFIVAYYGPELANRAVEFLRSNGVEAAAISANNGRFHYVVSLTPFSAAEVGSPAYEEHKSQLKRLGRVWKRDHNGPDDFSEVWAQKHRPSGQTSGRHASANDQ